VLPALRLTRTDLGAVAPAAAAKRNVHLDAMRAVAILLVVSHHFLNLPVDHPRWMQVIAHRGYVGVDLFFVLSGWLIGGQLFRSERQDAGIDVLRFWTRRWTRTLPAYYAVLAVLWVGRRGRLPLGDTLLFAQNYTAPTEWYVSWSLCIEEHFYLALPVVVLAVRRHRRIAFAVSAAFLFLSPVLRWTAYPSMANGSFARYLETFYPPTHLRLDGLVMGVLVAALREYEPGVWSAFVRHRLALALIGVCLFTSFTYNPWAYSWQVADRMSFFAAVPGFFGISAGVALTLPAAATAHSGPTWWSIPATWIAEHAFSLYLTHVTVFALCWKVLPVTHLPYVGLMLLIFSVAFVSAITLRRAVELPGLHIRGWIEAQWRP
jgi:peptidoglycan/LPS O-acetylase OafA/YrhL